MKCCQKIAKPIAKTKPHALVKKDSGVALVIMQIRATLRVSLTQISTNTSNKEESDMIMYHRMASFECGQPPHNTRRTGLLDTRYARVAGSDKKGSAYEIVILIGEAMFLLRFISAGSGCAKSIARWQGAGAGSKKTKLSLPTATV